MTQREIDLEHELSTALGKVDEQRELLRLCKEENEEKRKDIIWTMGERAKLIDRIKELEEELMEVKNKHAVLVADVVLHEDRGKRIKRLEEAGDYLCAAAAFMGWHDKIEAWNKAKEAK